MNVIINGERHEFRRSMTVRELLGELKIDSSRGMAVAINDSVVPKQEFDRAAITEGDRVEIIRATQGG